MREVLRRGPAAAAALGLAAVALATTLTPAGDVLAQALPNPYRMVETWAKLPGGRGMGAVGDVTIDRDGRHVWAVIRCEPLADPARFGDECRDSKADTVHKFAPDGTVVTSFGGGGMFIWPHGIDVDPDGNVWVTDAVQANRIPKGDKRGHQVVKFSAQGKVLMTLGMPGMSGSDQMHFNSPADVVVAPSGEIFVADGHNENGNNRIVRFSKDGKFLKAFGKTGYGPGEFRTLHGITMDAAGRLFVADRFNNRVQILDQDGKPLAQWLQFGRPSGVFLDAPRGRILVADSESDDVQNPGWDMGIRVGDLKTGAVQEFILFPWADPRDTAGNGAEFVAVDRDGNIYGGEPRPKTLRKYVRVRP